MTGIGEAVPMKTLSFVNDGCELLVQCHKVRSLIFKGRICRSPFVEGEHNKRADSCNFLKSAFSDTYS